MTVPGGGEVTAHRVTMDTSFSVVVVAWLRQSSRHQLPSSSIGNEFKF